MATRALIVPSSRLRKAAAGAAVAGVDVNVVVDAYGSPSWEPTTSSAPATDLVRQSL